MRIKPFLAGLFLTFFASTVWSATIVNYLGQDYSVTTLVGGYTANQAYLESQIWYTGDDDSHVVADYFALAVNSQLGFPNGGNGDLGPYFAISSVPNINMVAVTEGSPNTVGIYGTSDFIGEKTWAVAEAVVPIPAAAWLFGSALLGLAGIKRRKA